MNTLCGKTAQVILSQLKPSDIYSNGFVYVLDNTKLVELQCIEPKEAIEDSILKLSGIDNTTESTFMLRELISGPSQSGYDIRIKQATFKDSILFIPCLFSTVFVSNPAKNDIQQKYWTNSKNQQNLHRRRCIHPFKYLAEQALHSFEMN